MQPANPGFIQRSIRTYMFDAQCPPKVAADVPGALTRLLINIDHVATLRNARRETFPDPVVAAVLCEAAGADGIVFHLREDRRHINEHDVARLKETVQGKLDFELSAAPEIVSICCDTRPDLATLVPERRDEITTEGGLDVRRNLDTIKGATERLFASGIPEVALFVDPEEKQLEAVCRTGANAIELHTGDYATAPSVEAQQAEAERLAKAATQAHALGLTVHAGHGLDYRNYPFFAQTVPHVSEVSIGFAVVARAVMIGITEAVRTMRQLVKGY